MSLLTVQKDRQSQSELEVSRDTGILKNRIADFRLLNGLALDRVEMAVINNELRNLLKQTPHDRMGAQNDVVQGWPVCAGENKGMIWQKKCVKYAKKNQRQSRIVSVWGG